MGAEGGREGGGGRERGREGEGRDGRRERGREKEGEREGGRVGGLGEVNIHRVRLALATHQQLVSACYCSL